MRLPLRRELGCDRRHPLRRGVAVAARLGAVLAPVFLDHLAEHQLGVAHGAEGDRIVLAQVLAAVGHLGEGGAVRHRGSEGVAGKAGADAGDEVGLGEEPGDHQGARQAAGAERQGMGLRERALAGQRGHHRDLRQLGECDQLGGRLAVQHALPGDHHRIAGGQQRTDQVAHVLARRRRAVRPHRDVAQVGAGIVALHGIVDHLQQHRAAPSVAELPHGAPHHDRDVGRRPDLGRPLGDGAVGAHRLEGGRHALAAARRPARQVQQRHRIGVGLGHAGERVLGAGAVLHGEHPEARAVGHPRIPVGDVDAGPLLAADDGADADLGARLDQFLQREG